MDGTCDDNSTISNGLSLGGDASWEEVSRVQSGAPHGSQHWDTQMTGPNDGVYRPVGQAPSAQQKQRNQHSTERNQSHSQFKQECTQDARPLHGLAQPSSKPAASGAPTVVINGNSYPRSRQDSC